MLLFGTRGLNRREQARDLLAWAAEQIWGIPSLPEIAREERGKPFFPGFPQYQFNLSHSGKLALCALSDAPVGVDIQVIRPFWRPSLVDRSCTPAERAWLHGGGNRSEDFAALWAAKESIGKQSGRGLPYPPSREPVPVPPEGEALDLTQAYFLSDGRMLRFYRGDSWAGAVCGLETPPSEITWLEIEEIMGKGKKDGTEF